MKKTNEQQIILSECQRKEINKAKEKYHPFFGSLLF